MAEIINFRFRKGKDDDIKKAVEQTIAERKIDRSDIIREALRFYFYTQHESRISTKVNTDKVELAKKDKTDKELEGALDKFLDKV